MNEHRDIHPLVALWLTKNGYSYTHEYKLPDYGRVDFYATHTDGHTLLVEAKPKRYRRVIAQLASYMIQIPEARGAIALPKEALTADIVNVAQKYGISVIELDTSDIEPIEDIKPNHVNDNHANVAQAQDWLEILEYIADYYDSNVSSRIIDSILAMGFGVANGAYKEQLFTAGMVLVSRRLNRNTQPHE